MIRIFLCGILSCLLRPSLDLAAAEVPQQWEPLVRVMDLNVGETATLTLCNGTEATVKLVSFKEDRDVSLAGVMSAGESPQGPAQNAGDSQKSPAKDEEAESRLGVGFLWTRQSETVAAQLNGKKDFVDLILGPGKLHIFETVKPPVRVACIARSLEKNKARPFPGVKETIQILEDAKVPPKRVIIAYNPERQPGTPSAELDQLVASVQQARKLSRAYGAPLLVGPGLREMQGREELYPELAKHCDIWMIQSQRLQIDVATRKPVRVEEYRKRVKRITDFLRQGNPKIQIFVQVVTTAERGRTQLTAKQIADYASSVEDLVDAVRIYGGSPEILTETIKRLQPPVPQP